MAASLAGLLTVPPPRPPSFVSAAEMGRNDVPRGEDGGPALAALQAATPHHPDATLAKLPDGGKKLLALSEKLIPFRRAHVARDWGAESGVGFLDLAESRTAAKLVAEDAGRAARAGDTPRLRRRLLTLDRLARYAVGDPFMVGQYYGATMRTNAEKAAREALVHAGTRGAVEAYVADRGPLPDLERGLRSERFFLGWMTERGDRLKAHVAEAPWGTDSWFLLLPAPILGAVGARWRSPGLEALERVERAVQDAPDPLTKADAFDREFGRLQDDESLSRLLVRVASTQLQEAGEAVRRDAAARAETDELLRRTR